MIEDIRVVNGFRERYKQTVKRYPEIALVFPFLQKFLKEQEVEETMIRFHPHRFQVKENGEWREIEKIDYVEPYKGNYQ